MIAQRYLRIQKSGSRMQEEKCSEICNHILLTLNLAVKGVCYKRKLYVIFACTGYVSCLVYMSLSLECLQKRDALTFLSLSVWLYMLFL